MADVTRVIVRVETERAGIGRAVELEDSVTGVVGVDSVVTMLRDVADRVAELCED